MSFSTTWKILGSMEITIQKCGISGGRHPISQITVMRGEGECQVRYCPLKFVQKSGL